MIATADKDNSISVITVTESIFYQSQCI